MADCISDQNGRDLWREVRKIKRVNKIISPTIDGLSNDYEIANHFKSKYETLSNCVPAEPICMKSIKD